MGVIECNELDLITLIQNPTQKMLIVKDDYFDEVPTLIQKDKEKSAEAKFDFKLKVDGEWFLGTFYSDNPDNNEVSLSFSKFVEE